jgi:hypothetical protein
MPPLAPAMHTILTDAETPEGARASFSIPVVRCLKLRDHINNSGFVEVLGKP